METDLRIHRRPDGRVLAWPSPPWTPDQARRAVDFARHRCATLITNLAADRVGEQRILTDAGFSVGRRNVIVEVQLDAAMEAIGDVSLPVGVTAISAADADLDLLRLLDDALRDDVPGTAGWRSTPQEFADDTFGDPAFDPRTYLVAVEDVSGEYIDLMRVWMNRDGPRIGLFGVRRRHRRRGVTIALLRRCLRAAHDLGHLTATSEYDERNDASRGVFERLRARQTSSWVEFVADPGSPPA